LLQAVAGLSAELAERLREVRAPLAAPGNESKGDPVECLSLASNDFVLRFIRVNDVLTLAPQLWRMLYPPGSEQAGFEIALGGPAHHCLAIRIAIHRIVATWGWLDELRSGREIGPERRFDPINLPVSLESIDSLERSSISIRTSLNASAAESDAGNRAFGPDTKPDTRKKLRQPDSNEIRQLFRLMRTRPANGAILDCALEIVGDDRRRAENLMRQARNYEEYARAKARV
jgi:hypothetical protein